MTQAVCALCGNLGELELVADGSWGADARCAALVNTVALCYGEYWKDLGAPLLRGAMAALVEVGLRGEDARLNTLRALPRLGLPDERLPKVLDTYLRLAGPLDNDR